MGITHCNFMLFPLTFDKMILPKRNYLFLFVLKLCLVGTLSHAQTFNRYDFLHGKLNKNRSWFDVTMYDIKLRVEPEKQFIKGHNKIWFKTLKAANMMQLDLHGNMHIDSIVFLHKKLSYKRDSSVVMVQLPKFNAKKLNSITIYFSGHPLIAQKAPWDGGFVFTHDSSGNAWVGLACQGLGASVWLPCKDHNSDEADSVNMALEVPSGLTGVSNGKLVQIIESNPGYNTYVWQTRYPINNYNITVNVGKYHHFSDEYRAKYNTIDHPLKLDYYVLEYNYNKAVKHFQQVKTMMACFEKHFGPYPFWNDGYKLVETPYWGMEHQSCVSYGNNYDNNRWDFDFIIIHESAHEWFGNSLSANDPAELWLHETFTTHAEAVFIECSQHYDAAHKYLKMQKRNIENKYPMLGTPDVFFHHFRDNDIYYKGSWMLYTIRNVINNDTLWFNALKDYSNHFKYANLTTEQCIIFWSKRVNPSLRVIFKQYLEKNTIPKLQYSIKENTNGMLELRYRWVNVISNFEMPVNVTLSKAQFEPLMITTKWRVVDLNYFDANEFKIQTDHFLIETEKVSWD